MRRVAAPLAAPLLLAACASIAGIEPFTTSDAGHDAGHDVTVPHDAGSDTGRDTGVEAGHDAGSDGMPTVVVPYDSATPPAEPFDGATVTITSTMQTFAVRRLYVGDTLPTAAFPASKIAWQTIGYDLDGLDTTSATATNTCTPATPGAGVVDGLNGIDNAFGEVIVGDLNGVLRTAVDEGLHEADASTPISEILSEEIGQGQFTEIVNTIGIQPGTSMQTAIGLTGAAFTAGAAGASLPFSAFEDSGTEFGLDASWPVSPSSVLDGGGVADAAVVQFSTAYITNSVWVSGALSSTPPVTVPLTLIEEGHPLTFMIHHAVVTFVYVPTEAGQGFAVHGVLAGVLNTQELIQSLAATVGQVAGEQFCGAFRTRIEPILLAAQDMILGPDDAISNKPGVPCNAISVGIGFDADEIQVPTTVAPNVDAGSAAACSLDSGS